MSGPTRAPRAENLRNPLIAVHAMTDLAAHARALRETWEARLTDGPARPAVRPIIDQSWRRIATSGLDVRRLRPRPALADARAVDAARAASPLADALPVLRRCLCANAGDAEHVMVVCDAGGRILWVDGDPDVRRSAEDIGLAEGMRWTEDSAGTSAIGIALAIERAVQVFSAEHLWPELHAWSCSAAPINDPATGELLGAVNLSGPVRAAHPNNLALVVAAAALVEDRLRSRRAAEDHRLVETYVERAAPPRRSTAVVSASGQVLMAQPQGWVTGTLPAPLQEGPVTLPAGRRAVAEPLDDGRGWMLWEVEQRGRGAAPSPVLSLRLLGRDRRARVGDGPWLSLSLRHAEIVALLALRPGGLTGEQLTLHLFGETGKMISTRAELSRLRKVIGPCLAAKPYRLEAEVTADFLELERQLAAGELGSALQDYDGPLLAESQVLLIEQARDELEGALRGAATRGSLQQLWQWLTSEPGRDDAAALAEYLRRAPAGDPRRPVAAARLGALEAAWAPPERPDGSIAAAR